MKLSVTISVYLLALLMSAQALMAPLVYLDFKLRQDYIAKNFCEKKDQPIAVCYGSCYLKKELKKTAEEESRQTDSTSKLKLESICQQMVTHLPEKKNSASIAHIPLRSFTFSNYAAHLSEVFNPPQA